MTEISNIFTGYQKYLEDEQDTREEIRNIVRNLDQCGRDQLVILHNIHTVEGINQIPNICQQSRAQCGKVQELYHQLAGAIPPGQFYRYHDHWRAVTQRLVCLAALTVYLEREDLINRDQATEMLLGADVPKNFHLDLEDFLSGTLQLASELTRFAVNSVTLGDFQRPFHVATFLGNLNLGFRLLNLKNDSLRKKYDCLKYDLKKIEEVVYDLTIRGLKELDISPSAETS